MQVQLVASFSVSGAIGPIGDQGRKNASRGMGVPAPGWLHQCIHHKDFNLLNPPTVQWGEFYRLKAEGLCARWVFRVSTVFCVAMCLKSLAVFLFSKF